MVFLLGGFCFIAISAGRVYLPAGKEKSHICTRSPGADEGEGAKKHSTGAGFSGNLSSKMRNYQLNPTSQLTGCTNVSHIPVPAAGRARQKDVCHLGVPGPASAKQGAFIHQRAGGPVSYYHQDHQEEGRK